MRLALWAAVCLCSLGCSELRAAHREAEVRDWYEAHNREQAERATREAQEMTHAANELEARVQAQAAKSAEAAAADARQRECRETAAYFAILVRASKQDATDTAPTAGKKSEPKELYRLFAEAFGVRLPHYQSSGCDPAETVEFQAAWTDQQARETERQAQEAREIEARRRAAEEAVEALVLLEKTALKKGYKSLWLDGGLTAFLNDAVENGMPVRELARVAVLLSNEDSAFIAEQVLGNRALFVSGYSNARILVTGSSAYEGTSLTSALSGPAVVVTKVLSYRTAIGGSAQAFVVTPAW